MHNKKAIIVGATSGIGLELVKVLAQKGWTIGIAGRRTEILEEIKRQIPQVNCTQRIDICSEQATEQLDQLINALGGVNLYFHSSGIGFQNPELDEEKEMNTLSTNAVGFTHMVGHIFRYFEQHPEAEGHIAAISSIAGTKGLGAAPAYSSTKRFQSTYLQCLDQLSRMKKRNIHITDIRPGFVATALLSDGGRYPLQLQADKVAKEIAYALEHRKSVRIIDWRYRILVFLWRLIPDFIWVRLRIRTK